MNQHLFPPASPHAPRLANLLIRAGAIYSMARHRAVYGAIAIRDEWIVAISLDPHGLDGLIGAGTHVLDAPDLTILPAFEDTHNHLMFAAQNMGLVPVDRAHTLTEFIDLIRQHAAQTPPGDWIQTSAAWHVVNLVEGRLPTATELDEGASLSAGTDHPVSSFNPGLSLWGMVTRGTLNVGIQGPEYAIDQYTAVQLYTAAGAQLNGESHRRGTLQPRKLADLVAFRSNPIMCPVDDLPSLRPTFTMVGGRAVYDPEAMLGTPG